MRTAPLLSLLAAAVLFAGCSGGPVDLEKRAVEACDKELTRQHLSPPEGLFPTQKETRDGMTFFEVTASEVVCGVWVRADGSIGGITAGPKR